MLAARSSGGGVQPPHIHRKHSVASLSGTKRNSPDKRNASAGKTQSRSHNKASLIREIETTWYLKMFGLGKEETVATRTGMPYRFCLGCFCRHAVELSEQSLNFHL
uniref:Uncharacterized protein n=1 Tax=Knipowitschia caucasica TaxID=637954 RepID=A0AAV2J3L8_KNICA